MLTCTKRYTDLPFAHRQPNHKGHCSLIHGHNWGFEFEFQAKELEANGFVIDFGDLKWLRTWLEDNFDHTLVLNEDDPVLKFLQDSLLGARAVGREVESLPLAKIITVPNCGAEGLAKFVFEYVNRMLGHVTDGRVSLARVTVFEDLRNSATYTV